MNHKVMYRVAVVVVFIVAISFFSVNLYILIGYKIADIWMGLLAISLLMGCLVPLFIQQSPKIKIHRGIIKKHK